ncbi:cytochrome c [Gymnodinialimonas sp. 2305UL16-5]|uniref:c-type cytochrome n=1 Tax=Gymnodinialimonas mytili TaxID=3126503 RepID=UPI0030AE0969
MISLKNISSAAAIGAVALSCFALSAQAQGGDSNPAVSARQGQFQLMGLNIGVLGQMARGNTEYDAEAAQAAADNLLAISQINQMFHWPEGTDTESIEGTRALPAIWEEGSTVLDIWADYGAAAETLAGAAGQGLDEMRAALGPVGAACGSCHDDYRAPE